MVANRNRNRNPGVEWRGAFLISISGSSIHTLRWLSCWRLPTHHFQSIFFFDFFSSAVAPHLCFRQNGGLFNFCFFWFCFFLILCFFLYFGFFLFFIPPFPYLFGVTSLQRNKTPPPPHTHTHTHSLTHSHSQEYYSILAGERLGERGRDALCGLTDVL